MLSASIKLQYMHLLSEHRKHLQQNPRLVYLFLELTDQCNLFCLHCGSNCKSSNYTQLDFECAKKALKSVAEKMNPHEIMICFTGGEPILYQHFYEMAAYVRDLGFSWGMTSNGTMITGDAADKLMECGLGTISISIDGLADKHDWLRRSQGSFAAAIKGIQALQNCCLKKITLQVTTVVHKKNIGQLDRLYELLLKMKIKNWRIINMEPIGRALRYPELLLEAGDYRYLLEYIREKRRTAENEMEVTYGCSHYLTVDYEREVRDYYFICGAGIYVASIMCNGDIVSCLDIERRPELVQGNIKTDNFLEIWNNRFKIFRTDRTEQCSLCSKCSDKEFCHADSMHTWDFDRKEPRLCMKQKLQK